MKTRDSAITIKMLYVSWNLVNCYASIRKIASEKLCNRRMILKVTQGHRKWLCSTGQCTWHLDRCHTCDFVASFCPATVWRDKITIRNCACCNCNKSPINGHGVCTTFPFTSFVSLLVCTNWVRKLCNCSHIFFFELFDWTYVHFWFTIELTETKLLATRVSPAVTSGNVCQEICCSCNTRSYIRLFWR